MPIVPEILRLIDASERFTPCHLWDGPFGWRRVALYEKRRVVRVLWEMAHGQEVPFGYTLINACGHMTCVRLDHWRFVTMDTAKRAGEERVMRNHLARLKEATEAA